MTESLLPRDRIALLRILKSLPKSTFEEVRIALRVPPDILPGDSAEQGTRASALMDWANGPLGCGEVELKGVVDEVVEYHRSSSSGRSSKLPTGIEPPPPPIESESPKPSTDIEPPPPPPPAEPEKNIQVKLPNGALLDLVYIPAGVFYMGSPSNEEDRMNDEGPQHKVNVPAFYMGKYPVTQAQWYAVSLLDEVEKSLSPRPSSFEGDTLPVEEVSWDDAVEFCQRLSHYTQQAYRLPSEAEWEYACRAGTSSRYSFGSNITWDQVNCRIEKTKTVDGILGIGRREVVEKESYGRTTAVGSFPANNFGLFDMHGNVWEWCLDRWHENYEGAPTDGSAWLENTPQSNNRRVIRGGSWDSNPRVCRSAYRYRNTPDHRGYSLGFRVVLAPR